MQSSRQNILLLAVTCLLCLLSLEATLRVYLYGADSLLYHKMKSIVPIDNSGFVQAAQEEDLIYELKPNVNSYFLKAKFVTNSQGLRDKEYPLQKQPGTFRVAVVGDSFTMPDGVAIEDAFHSLLEKKFTQAFPGRHYEFINFGVAGYALNQYLAMIQHKVLAFEPDMILIGFCPFNDHFLPEGKRYEVPYHTQKTVNRFFHLYSIEAVGRLVERIQRKISGQAAPQEDLRLTPERAAFVTRILSVIGKISREKSIPVVIAYLGYRPNPVEELLQLVKKLCAENGMNFVNVNAAFQSRDIPTYRIYRADTHPNPKAHRIFADHLYGYLEDFLRPEDVSKEA